MLTKTDVSYFGIKDYFIRNYPDDPINEKFNDEEIQLCKKFIQTCLKPSRKGRSSYHYKHAVERYFNRYISNGSFIMACIIEGVPQVRLNLGPNTIVKMDYKDKETFRKCNGQMGGA